MGLGGNVLMIIKKLFAAKLYAVQKVTCIDGPKL